MAAALRIARPEDAERALRLVTACHDEAGRTPDPEARESALSALLAQEVPGAFYLIGPPSSPVGYAAVSLGHAISAGGTVAWLDEIYIRPAIRRRGMATEAILAIAKMLGENGVRSLHTLPWGEQSDLFRRLRFESGAASPMTRTL